MARVRPTTRRHKSLARVGEIILAWRGLQHLGLLGSLPGSCQQRTGGKVDCDMVACLPLRHVWHGALVSLRSLSRLIVCLFHILFLFVSALDTWGLICSLFSQLGEHVLLACESFFFAVAPLSFLSFLSSLFHESVMPVGQIEGASLTCRQSSCSFDFAFFVIPFSWFISEFF